MIDKALILAAGKGTRMWPLTDNTPKPLLPLCGEPIIQRQIKELKKIGVEKVYVLIGYRMKEISDFLGDGEEYGVKIEYIVQDKQKGTGHAVLQAEGRINDDFYCVNGDINIDSNNLGKMGKGKNEVVMITTKVCEMVANVYMVVPVLYLCGQIFLKEYLKLKGMLIGLIF